jgi:cyclophilin family peptidyl-prolyl cis-trans isomerase
VAGQEVWQTGHMKKLLSILIAFLPALQAEEPAVSDLPDGLYAEFVTPRGTVVCELFFEKTPMTVANFVGLAEGTLGPRPGQPYFNGIKFHRVVPDFVVQGGDPTGTGSGGPGYSFPDEFIPGLRHDDTGILSMANAGPDTNGSQFFLTLREVNRLNYLHSVFGRAVRGREVLPLIEQDDVMSAVNILRVGAAAEAFRADQTSFDALTARATRHILAHFDDPENLLPAQPPRARNFNFKLANFERATGVRLLVRLQGKYEPETPGQRPGTHVGRFARRLALGPDDVLAVYFADIDQWAFWAGDRRLQQFMGRAGMIKEFMQGGELHRAKQALLATVQTRGDAFIAEAARSLPEDKPLTDAQKIKLRVDGMIDTLIEKFEPAP